MGQDTQKDYGVTVVTGFILLLFRFLFSDAIFDFIERRSLITQILFGILFVILVGFVIIDEIIKNRKKNKAIK